MCVRGLWKPQARAMAVPPGGGRCEAPGTASSISDPLPYPRLPKRRNCLWLPRKVQVKGLPVFWPKKHIRR